MPHAPPHRTDATSPSTRRTLQTNRHPTTTHPLRRPHYIKPPAARTHNAPSHAHIRRRTLPHNNIHTHTTAAASPHAHLRPTLPICCRHQLCAVAPTPAHRIAPPHHHHRPRDARRDADARAHRIAQTFRHALPLSLHCILRNKHCIALRQNARHRIASAVILHPSHTRHRIATTPPGRIIRTITIAANAAAAATSAPDNITAPISRPLPSRHNPGVPCLGDPAPSRCRQHRQHKHHSTSPARAC